MTWRDLETDIAELFSCVVPCVDDLTVVSGHTVRAAVQREFVAYNRAERAARRAERAARHARRDPRAATLARKARLRAQEQRDPSFAPILAARAARAQRRAEREAKADAARDVRDQKRRAA